VRTTIVGFAIADSAMSSRRGLSGTVASQAFNPLLTAGSLAPWIALGIAGTTLLIALFARAALKHTRPQEVRSATGFYYIPVVAALTAEIAVKTRIFPA
jgi:hypothetical protein